MTRSPDDSTGFRPNVSPTLEIRRATAAIKIDGELNDDGWQQATAATNFTEIQPGDQTKPPVDTETLIAYTDTHFYLAFKAFDSVQQPALSGQARSELAHHVFSHASTR